MSSCEQPASTGPPADADLQSNGTPVCAGSSSVASFVSNVSSLGNSTSLTRHFITPPNADNDEAIRVLVCGDVCGQFSRLSACLKSAQQKQGPFNFALCTGRFFTESTDYQLPDQEVESVALHSVSNATGLAQQCLTASADDAAENECTESQPYAFLSGRNSFAVPVYFIDSSISSTGFQLRRRYPNGYQFSSTLRYLGNYGFCEIAGLTIGYLSGRYSTAHFFGEDGDEETVDVFDEMGSPRCATATDTDRACEQRKGSSEAADSVVAQESGLQHVEKGNAEADQLFAEQQPKEALHTTGSANETSSFPGDCAATTELNTTEDLSSERSRGQRYFTGPQAVYYCRSALRRMKEVGSAYEGRCDLFVSCEWPAGLDETLSVDQRNDLESLLRLGERAVCNQRPVCTAEQDKHEDETWKLMTSPAISEVVEFLEPRYHVASGSGVFYQRPPYKTSTHGYACKFIGLGRLQCSEQSGKPPTGESKRLRFLHALVLKPVARLPRAVVLAIPSASTPSPYFSLYNPNAPSTIRSFKPSVPFFTDDRGLDALNNRGRKRNSGIRHDEHGDPTTLGSSAAHSSGHLTHKRNPISRNASSSPLRSGSCHASSATPPSFRPPHYFPDVPADPAATKRHCSGLRSAGSEPSPLKAVSSGPGGRPVNPPTTCVFISNIPFQVDTDSFMDIMTSFGEVVQATVPRTPDGKSSGRAWITYKTLEEAERAVAAHDQLQSGGRLLKIQFSYSGAPGQRSCNHANGSRANTRCSGTGVGQTPEAIDVRAHTGCWFCLTNPNSQRQLIVAEGQKVYVALAKGGLVSQHVLVIPRTHYPNFIFCPADVSMELVAFIQALRDCYKSQNMETIVFERYFPMKMTTGMHMQIQVIPIPLRCASKSMKAVHRRAERAGIQLVPLSPEERMTDLWRHVKNSIVQPYFYIELPGSQPNHIERWIYYNPNGQQAEHKLPFNFGREAVADLLETPQRANWKTCVEPESTEEALVQEMQSVFIPFQPEIVRSPDTATSQTSTT